MGKQLLNPLFSMNDFRPYVRSWADGRGRGEFRRIAEKLKMHTTLLSQVMSGKKHFTEEQAAHLCGYMGLNVLESDYFLKLVQIDRAGNERLKTIFGRHLLQLRKQSSEIRSRVPESKEMSEQDRAIFYSSWQYGLIRLLTSIDRYQTAEKISLFLNLSASRVREVLEFLVSRELCTQDREGRFKRTERNTHVEAQSPLAIRHHQNWRAKSIDLQERSTLDDVSFTAPVSVAKRDIEKVRAILLEAVSDVAKIVENSPPEEVVYFGIDWIKM
jgi:uncharacterized protein (TIGR02147 family)